MKNEKYKYTMNLVECFLKDNNIKYGSYKIKDCCTDVTVGYLEYSENKCKLIVIPSLAKYGQSESELIISIISNNCYLIPKTKYFYTIGPDLKVLLSDESHFTEEEIDEIKSWHNYFNCDDFVSADDLAKQFVAHICNNRYNLLATFIPKIKK